MLRAKLADWRGFEARRAEARRRGVLRGIGLGYYIEASGGQPSEQATLRVTPEGRIQLIVGTFSHGQGHETAFLQIVSQRLPATLQLGIAPQGCLYVGDGAYGELSGAEAVGMHPVLIRDPDEQEEMLRPEAEEWARLPVSLGGGREAYDAVTARAVAGLPVLAEYAAPLLRPSGVLVAWKGRVDADALRGGKGAADELGLSLEDVASVQPFPEVRDRHLYVFRKVAPTPERFPRRPGMAVKRPLGAG